MFSPPKISETVLRNKTYFLRLLSVFYVTQPSDKQMICYDYEKQDSALPYSILGLKQESPASLKPPVFDLFRGLFSGILLSNVEVRKKTFFIKLA